MRNKLHHTINTPAPATTNQREQTEPAFPPATPIYFAMPSGPQLSRADGKICLYMMSFLHFAPFSLPQPTWSWVGLMTSLFFPVHTFFPFLLRYSPGLLMDFVFFFSLLLQSRSPVYDHGSQDLKFLPSSCLLLLYCCLARAKHARFFLGGGIG